MTACSDDNPQAIEVPAEPEFVQLGRYAYLLNNGSDVLYGIVGCSVELLYVGASSFVEGATTFAFVTGFAIGRR